MTREEFISLIATDQNNFKKDFDTPDKLWNNFLVHLLNDKEQTLQKRTLSIITKKLDGLIELATNSTATLNTISNLVLPNQQSVIEEQKTPEEIFNPQTMNDEDKEFLEIMVWINENAAEIQKMQQTLTKKEYFKLKEKYSIEQLQEVFTAMSNWTPLLTKSKSTSKTAHQWLIKRERTQSRGGYSYVKKASMVDIVAEQKEKIANNKVLDNDIQINSAKEAKLDQAMGFISPFIQ